MRKSEANVFVLGLVSLAASSCAAILGLDQFSEGKGTGGAGGAGGSGGTGGGPDLCGDGKKDGAETGKDCGGPCSPCADGEGCAVGPDCASKVCGGGTCIMASCSDKVKNGAEADVDCGGTCPKCGPAQSCTVDGDCISGKCTSGACVSTCTDGLKGGAETDVDCGGGLVTGCPGCASGGACKVGGDCASGVCRMEKCVDSFVWGKHFAAPQGMAASPNAVAPFGLVMDKSNNILMSAGFAGVADFGSGPVGAVDTNGRALTKFDPAGAVVWSAVVGSPYTNTTLSGFAPDASGGTVICGGFSGTVNFDGLQVKSAGGQDMFIAGLDAFGKTSWVKSFGDADEQGGAYVQIDGQGNFIVSGSFRGAIDMGGGVLTSAGDFDIVIAKFAPNGAHLWSKRFGGAFHEFSSSLQLDSAGDIIFSATVAGSVDFGGGPLSAATVSDDVAIVKLDPSGNHLWSRRFGSSATEGGAVIVDPVGNIVLSMSGYDGSSPPVPVDLGGGPLLNLALLAKFDPAGKHLWSKGVGALGTVVADAAGNLLMTGPCWGNVDFGSGVLKCPGTDQADVYLAKFDPAGTSVWSRRFGDAQFQQSGFAIGILAGTGDVALLGQFSGMLDFGGGAIPTSTSSIDTFLVRLRLP